MEDRSFGEKWTGGAAILLIFLLYPVPTVYHYVITQHYGREVGEIHDIMLEFEEKYVYCDTAEEARAKNPNDPFLDKYEEASDAYCDATIAGGVTLLLIIFMPKFIKILIYLITLPYFWTTALPWLFS
ncbi:MAG: hypothetical protein ACOCRX_01415 [Candidatus Woesearchaeota archaeon]